MTKILARYSNHFKSERSQTEWELLYKDYYDLLADLPQEFLERALYNLGRSLRWFPKVGEIREEAERLIAAAPRPSQPGDEPLHVRLDKEAKRYVKSFMLGDLGIQAKEEGWRDLLSGYMLSATYNALLRAHQTGGAPNLPTTVPSEIVASYRRMRPPIQQNPTDRAGEGKGFFRSLLAENE